MLGDDININCNNNLNYIVLVIQQLIAEFTYYIRCSLISKINENGKLYKLSDELENKCLIVM